jgi:hypothetical protein
LNSNAQRRQAEPRGRNTGDRAMVFIGRGAVCPCAIEDQAGWRTSLFPKVLKRSPLKILKKLLVSWREAVAAKSG